MENGDIDPQVDNGKVKGPCMELIDGEERRSREKRTRVWIESRAKWTTGGPAAPA